MKKRALSALLALMLLLALTPSASASRPSVEEVEYERGGYVEISFYGRVQYRSPKVRVYDATGHRLSTRIVERDNDDLTFKVSGVQQGHHYTFKISGLRKRGTSSYATVHGSFRAYDWDD